MTDYRNQKDRERVLSKLIVGGDGEEARLANEGVPNALLETVRNKNHGGGSTGSEQSGSTSRVGEVVPRTDHHPCGRL